MKRILVLLTMLIVFTLNSSQPVQAFSSVLGTTSVSTQSISIGGNNITSPDVPVDVDNNKPSFSGYTIPNSKITLTFQSEPIIREALSDATGFWEYTLDVPLEPGTHELSMQVTDQNGNKSENKLVATFKVPESSVQAAIIPSPIPKKIEFNYFTLTLGVIGSLTILGILYALIIKNSRRK